MWSTRAPALAFLPTCSHTSVPVLAGLAGGYFKALGLWALGLMETPDLVFL